MNIKSSVGDVYALLLVPNLGASRVRSETGALTCRTRRDLRKRQLLQIGGWLAS